MNIQVDIRIKLNEFNLQAQFESESNRIGILGASGSGKSMTLKAIAGIITPNQGRIVVNNQVFFDSDKKINIPPQKRRIGYLFQNYALFPTMTVEENIASGLPGRRTEKIKEIVATMISRFKLGGLEKRYPKELSGGQQQRVALARIMAYEPNLIMLDEPFSALDSYLKDSMKLEMKHLLEEFAGGMIMVSHSRDEIYEFGEELLIMHQGSIIETGNTKELFDKPCQLESARLTGCKNLSKAKRIDDYHVYAMDWDFILETQEVVTERVTYVGMRSHHLRAYSETNENKFKLEIIDVAETPFEYKVILRKENSNAKPLWWKLSKERKHDFIREKRCELGIQPENILLLIGRDNN